MNINISNILYPPFSPPRGEKSIFKYTLQSFSRQITTADCYNSRILLTSKFTITKYKYYFHIIRKHKNLLKFAKIFPEFFLKRENMDIRLYIFFQQKNKKKK